MSRPRRGVFAERLRLAARFVEVNKERGVTSRDLADALGVSIESARTLLSRLASTGKYDLIEVQGILVRPKTEVI